MAETPKKVAPKPTRALPTPRIAYAKQLDLLRAFGTTYVQTGLPVTQSQVAQLIGLQEDTSRLANTFFLDVGLIQRVEAGFVPNGDVISFHRAKEWNFENPEFKLGPTFRETWFAKALLTPLSFKGSLEETDAIGILAEAANATTDYRAQLVLLLSFLESAGVIVREGTNLKPLKGAPNPERDRDKALPVLPTPPPAPASMGSETPGGKNVEQQLLEILDPDQMSDEEQSAVWALMKYLKRKRHERSD